MQSMPLEEVVTRWVHQPVRPVEEALAGEPGLRLHGPFADSIADGHRTWTARGRLPDLRRARVELQVTRWSPEVTEVSLRPLGRRLVTWGPRRERRYFQGAHDAASRVASLLTTRDAA